MPFLERAVSLLVPDISRAEKRVDLINLADETVSVFRDVLDLHAREMIDDPTPKRLRQLLANKQGTLAVVDQRRQRMLRAFCSDHRVDKRVSLVIVVNGGKLTEAPPEERNKEMDQLLKDYQMIVENMPPEAKFEQLPLTRPWHCPLRVLDSKGIKPHEVELRLYE